ncbi:MAG: hypothetical protein J6A89_03410 [Clostridia bacterium]|nr:hypothetical protein [Clostridia bacterium]
MNLLTEKNKKKIIIYLILWLTLAIVFVLPISVAAIDSINEKFELNKFTSIVGNYILNIETRVKAFQSIYISNTKALIGYYTFFYCLVLIVIFLQNKGTKNYYNIEHGSSDWCKAGEQYKILSRNSGILLAQKNYLPLNKPGNINVLLIGRIRFR